MEVRVQGNLDGALRILKRKLAREGIFHELNRRVAALKPSEKKKRKRVAAAARRAKDVKLRERAQERWSKNEKR